MSHSLESTWLENCHMPNSLVSQQNPKLIRGIATEPPNWVCSPDMLKANHWHWSGGKTVDAYSQTLSQELGGSCLISGLPKELGWRFLYTGIGALCDQLVSKLLTKCWNLLIFPWPMMLLCPLGTLRWPDGSGAFEGDSHILPRPRIPLLKPPQGNTGQPRSYLLENQMTLWVPD